VSLRDACSRGVTIRPLTFEWHNLPRTAKTIEQRWGELSLGAPAPFELAPLVDIVRAEWDGKGTLEGLQGAPKRHLAPALFYPEDAPSGWLANRTDLLAAALRVVQSRSAYIKALLRMFLRVWPASDAIRDPVQRTLRAALRPGQQGPLRIVSDRVARYHLLSLDGPGRFAERLLTEPARQEDILLDAGITADLRRSAFMAATERALCERLRKKLLKSDVSDIHACLALFVQQGELAFMEQAPDVAGALLLPFADAARTEELGIPIQRFLLTHLGDPRLEPAGWLRVDPVAKQVMLRWLVGASLERFFALIARSAMEQHWTYRRAFWTAYHERNLISEAWVVLGDDALDDAQRRWAEDELACGRLLGNSDRSHCVLLLRIGDLVIAEWSHNGTCRLWHDDSASCPRMYKRAYWRTELQDQPDERQTHHGNLTYGWQQKLAEKIRRRTGIRMTQVEYRVR
jgi:hypothetical protein